MPSTPTREREDPDAVHRAQSFFSSHPALIFFTIALTVFAAEALVMLLLAYLPRQAFWREAMLDATLLVALISPALYVLLFRPMVVHISERRKIEETLRKNEEEQFKIMIRTSLDGFCVTNVRGRFLEVNDAYCHMMGYSRDELLRMDVSGVETIESPQDTALHIGRLIEAGSERFETRQRCKDGRILDMEVSANYSPLHDGQIYSFLRDITAHKRSQALLLENEIRLKDLFENLRSGVAIYQASPNGQGFVISAFNKAAERIENLRREDVIGKDVVEVFPGITQFGLLDVFQRVWQSGVAEHLPVTFYQDERIAGWRDNYVYKLPNGEVVAIYDDVTKERQAEEKMHYRAHYDTLTGLPNRTLFADRLQQALATARRGESHLALMFLDLDKFKPVNDEFGHDVGDLLLIEVAKRMRNCVRESDTVSRIGGDEFVVLLPAIEAEPDAMLVAEKILSALNQPFELANHCIHISASIGVAAYPEHGSDETTLTKSADIAMYNAKNGGRNRARLYHPDMLGW
jgi:diguanylate cyclase (GGDEF)-like protein/PAS domain S-box-containing protein